MKYCFAFLKFFIAATAVAATTNEYLTVNQDGELSHPQVVASIADIASTAADAQLASAKASAAASAAAEATNALAVVVQDLADRDLVVYQQGYTTAFDKTVFISPDAKLVIYKVKPDAAIDDDLVAFDIWYACTESAAGVDAIVKYNNNLLEEQSLWPNSTTVDGPYTADPYTDEKTGQYYGYGYKVRVWHPAAAAGFFRVVLEADDAMGSAYVFDISGGISGGTTQDVEWDGNKLKFVGGLLVNVEDAE